MSGRDGRTVSCQDIQLVQNHIEKCLRLYMNKKEVVNALMMEDNIEPQFTELVWQKLEEENREFFEAYYLKLLVKEQITEFNRLLSEQVEVMRRIGLTGIVSTPMSNGSHLSHDNNGLALRMGVRQQPISTSLPNAFTNGGSSIHSCMQGLVDVSIHNKKIDIPPHILAQTSNSGMTEAMNGKNIKTEAGYGGSSPFSFCPRSNLLESCPVLGDPSVSSFSSVESNSQALHETLLDGDTSSFGFFGQIPQNFGIPDLAADFSSSSDLLENYPRPPFLATDSNSFLDAHGDIETLDRVPQGLKYPGFHGD